MRVSRFQSYVLVFCAVFSALTVRANADIPMPTGIECVQSVYGCPGTAAGVASHAGGGASGLGAAVGVGAMFMLLDALDDAPEAETANAMDGTPQNVVTNPLQNAVPDAPQPQAQVENDTSGDLHADFFGERHTALYVDPNTLSSQDPVYNGPLASSVPMPTTTTDALQPSAPDALPNPTTISETNLRLLEKGREKAGDWIENKVTSTYKDAAKEEIIEKIPLSDAFKGEAVKMVEEIKRYKELCEEMMQTNEDYLLQWRDTTSNAIQCLASNKPDCSTDEVDRIQMDYFKKTTKRAKSWLDGEGGAHS